GQVATAGLGADAVVELEGKIGGAHQFRHGPRRPAGVIELPAGDHHVDPMNGGQIVEYVNQPVVVLLRVVDGDELGGRVELVEQAVGVGRVGQPLHPPALALGALGFGL